MVGTAPKNAKDFGEWLEENPTPQASQYVDLQFLILRQIDRCNILLSEGSAYYHLAVDAFENTIAPYLDEEYFKKCKTIRDIIKKRLDATINKSGQIDGVTHSNAKFYQAKHKFKLLMHAAERSGLLPSKSLEMTLE